MRLQPLFKLVAGSLVGTLMVAGAVQAAPTVIYSGVTATAIQGVVVNGKTYDVSFVFDFTDTTFSGDSAAVAQAVQEVDAALNATPVAFVAIAGIGTINNFTIGDRSNGGTTVTSFSTAGRWRNLGFLFSGGLEANSRFTERVPEPASLALAGTALIALAFGRRRRAALCIGT